MTRLDLSNNRLADVAALRPLAALPALAELDTAGCPCAPAGANEDEEEAYRTAVFALLPQLTALDKRSKAGEERCAVLFFLFFLDSIVASHMGMQCCVRGRG